MEEKAKSAGTESLLPKLNMDLTTIQGAEDQAIKLAAFSIMKELCEEGKITEEELRYIAEKRNLGAEKM